MYNTSGSANAYGDNNYVWGDGKGSALFVNVIGGGNYVRGIYASAYGDVNAVVGNGGAYGSNNHVNASSQTEPTTLAPINDITFAFGSSNTVYGNATIATGISNTVKGKESNVLGSSNNVTAENVSVVGNKNKVSASNAIVLGSNASVSNANALVLGNGAGVNVDNSIALGTGSVASTVESTGSTTIKNQSYSFAGSSAQGTLSIGTSGSQRTLTNLAAGTVSASSTDAVNGSQLYAAIQAIETGSTEVKTSGRLTVNKETGSNGQSIYTISDTPYTAGSNVTISDTGEISSKNTTYTLEHTDNAGDNTTTITLKDSDNRESTVTVATKDTRNTVTAGDHVTLVENANTDGSTAYTVSVKTDGAVASGNTGIVTGGAVYTETRVAADGNYTRVSNTAGQNLTALDTQVKQNADSVSALNIQVEENADKISANTNSITALDSRVEQNTNRITAVDTRVGQNAGNITALDTRVGENANAISANTNRITAVDTRVSQNANSITALDTRVGQNANNISTLHTQMGQAANTMAALDTHVKQNTSNIATLDNKVTQNSNTISALDMQVKKNAENIATVSHFNDNFTNRLNRMDDRIDRVGAGAAALAALHPQDFDPSDKWDFAAGYGHYRSANAMAIGAFYRPDERTLLSVGGSMGSGENLVNAGVTFKLGKSSPYAGYSKAALTTVIADQKTTIHKLENQVATQQTQITNQQKQIEEIMRQLAELKK